MSVQLPTIIARQTNFIRQPVQKTSHIRHRSSLIALSATQQGSPAMGTVTCRRCKQQFNPSENHDQACRFHSSLWTGGEISKAIGFCRQSDAPEHQLKAVVGRTGLIRFWDCCGAEDENAPGCCVSRHKTYDDPDD